MLAKCLLGAAAFAALGFATWNWATQPEIGRQKRSPSRPNPSMSEHKGLGDFLKRLTSQDRRPEYCAVRVQLPSEDGSPVPVWVDVVRAEGDVLIGAVSTCDKPLIGRRLGDPIRVKAPQVDDWMVIERGSVHGALSLADN
ncbi:MAG: DUF2314 domain-containing protein [Fimbriimonadaceae bacterium]|nr:DUF2314 domain-containing protein [Fimbriimonadaceae bacterium]